MRALIAGVPNVGKSTLINILMDRAVAEVGDKPAVTKRQQAVVFKDGMTLTDSPGMLWPKIEDEDSAFRLALAGSIPDTAIDYLTIALFGADSCSRGTRRWPWRAQAGPDTCKRRGAARGDRQARGALRPGGVVELHRAAEIFVREFRSGVIGRISLEAPPA